jgi:hypothetical protein
MIGNSKYDANRSIARDEQNFSVDVKSGFSRKSDIWIKEITQKTRHSS